MVEASDWICTGLSKAESHAQLAEKEVAAQAKERHAWTQVSIRRPGGFFLGPGVPCAQAQLQRQEDIQELSSY